MKQCVKCNIKKPIDEFHRDKTRKDGRFPYCKTCCKPYAKEGAKRRAEREKIAPPPYKICSECKETKSISDFYKHIVSRDGYAPHCKQCHNQRVRQYQKTPKGKRIRLKTARKYARKYVILEPVKIKAHRAIRSAVRNGKLLNANERKCQHCRNQAEEYHHWSYAKSHWLDVIPLCKQCHTDIHSKER